MDKENSSTVQVYYKGFSVLITDRSIGKNPKELLTDAMSLIDFAIAGDCKPSWNQETNKQLNGASGQAALPERPTKPCSEHEGSLLVQRKGKDGIPFWSHIIEGQYQPDGKPKWCNGRKTPFTVREYDA